jgi:hypothetical protein
MELTGTRGDDQPQQTRPSKKSSRERSRPGTPYPAREVSMTVVNRSSTTVDDVSPWPQADRVNPTQGELAEERNRRSNHRFWRKGSDVS